MLVANPTAGSWSKRRFERIIRRLSANGCSVHVHETSAPGDAERFIAGNDCAPYDAIAAAGGDGTFNEVLNGLPRNGPPLAILPFGSVNVLAKEIGLKPSIDAVADAVAFGPSRPITIGEANGRRFAMMASVGLDAQVVDKVDLTLKRYVGKWAYLYETVKQLALSPPPAFRLRVDDGMQDARGVIIANGRFYAGHYVTSPTADLEKPRLDICRLTRPGRLAPPSYLMSLVLGGFAKRADVLISEASKLEITGPSGAPLQADGDVICRLPATIRVLPAAIDLIFPAETRQMRV